MARPSRQRYLQRLFKPSLILLLICTSTNGVYGEDFPVKCPNICKCYPLLLTENFLQTVRIHCTSGGMRAVPIDQMDQYVSKLTITAPANLPNHLTIGPIFTHPSLFIHLKELTIAHSNVPSIGESTFWGLRNLKILCLTHNKLTNIGKENFKGLQNLTELYLSHNKIDNMPSETFVFCTSLKKLDLAHNQISKLMPRIFRMHGKLQHLDMSYNPLEDLNPESFKDIQQLNVFKCRGCQLKQINTQIYHVAPLLEEIDLGNNLFKYFLSDDFTNLKKLKILKLDGNQLSVLVDNLFGHNSAMQHFNIASNRLAMIAPYAFKNLTKLSYLDISYNKIERFHLQTFGSIVRSIKMINFSGNNMPLSEVALVLQIIPDIRGVGLANLSLTEIPPNFLMHNDVLQELDISWNKLTKFPIQLLSKTMSLRRLDISNNHLSALDEQDITRLEGIPVISLSNNRWACNQCSAGPMIELMGKSVLNGSMRELRCYSPMRLRGTKLSNMNYDLLEICPVTHEIRVAIAVGVMVLLVTALLVTTGLLLCARNRVAHYYTNEGGKRCNRAHDHPEEPAPCTELSALATIHAPFATRDSS